MWPYSCPQAPRVRTEPIVLNFPWKGVPQGEFVVVLLPDWV
jgi:hypothetical protein